MAYYHPTNDLLMQFAAGQLANALGIMVACHLENCAQCRGEVALFNHVGGELIDSIEPIKVGPELLSATLNRLDKSATEPKNPTATNNIDQRLPVPLRRFVPQAIETLPWTGMVPSIQEYVLPISDQQYTAKLLKIAAGKQLPNHTHKGNEFTFVMQGSYSDAAGDYRPGDFIAADTEIIHQPHAGDDIDCICFAVLDAPLKLTGFWGRMLNPFIS